MPGQPGSVAVEHVGENVFGDATVTPEGHTQLRRSAETMARVGLRYMIDEGFRSAVRDDFERAKAGGQA